MDADLFKEKIKIAKEAVKDEEEPYKTEAFKVLLNYLLGQESKKITISKDISKEYPISKKEVFSFSGLSKHIYSLVKEGFFDRPMLLKEVKIELEKNSCFYDIRRIDKSLREVFVKNNKILTRVKNGPKWAYVVRK